MNKLKILHFNEGLWLYYHRLENNKFKWPMNQYAMPLYSQETYIKMLESNLSRQTLSNWIMSVSIENDILKQGVQNIYDENEGIIQSFSKKGYPYDNVPIKSFHAILKKEEVYSVKYFDYDSAIIRLFKYIEGWYNRKRIHGSINFMTLDEFESLCRAS